MSYRILVLCIDNVCMWLCDTHIKGSLTYSLNLLFISWWFYVKFCDSAPTRNAIYKCQTTSETKTCPFISVFLSPSLMWSLTLNNLLARRLFWRRKSTIWPRCDFTRIWVSCAISDFTSTTSADATLFDFICFLTDLFAHRAMTPSLTRV